MNRICHSKNKVLALPPNCVKHACGIMIAGIALRPVLAAANSVNSANPESSDAIPANVLTISDLRPLEVVSTKASDLVVETPAPLPIAPPEMNPNLEETGDAPVEDPSTPTTNTAPTLPQSSGEREASPPRSGSRLTGDWGGFRSQLEDAGITFDLEFTQFYQGLVSGTGSQTFEYGGRLDGVVNFDLEKLGLWQGGGLHTHLEYRFGNLPGTLGGAFFPTNAGMAFPFDSPDSLVATSLYLSQKLGDRASLLIGKLSILHLVDDPFFGGWGIHKFWNTVFVAPPSGLVPAVFYGAIANVNLDPVTLSFWVYDPDDRTQEYWPDNLFGNGVTFLLKTAYTTEIAGRPTIFSLSGTYSTKTGTDFSSVDEAVISGTKPLTKSGSYSIGFQISHLLHQNPSNPQQGWGLYLRGSVADGDPNYVQNSIYGGIGGTGLFRGRELDSFGLGYFYYNLSNALQDSFNALSQGASFGNVQGVEAYYSYAVTPWFYLGADIQYINPPLSSFENALIAGLRANIRF